MKLLLTSNGLSNESIAKALFELVGKPASDTVCAFVPTAANVSTNDKGWLIDDLVNCQKQGFKLLNIVDISAIPRSMWEPRLRAVDVLIFGGGEVSHLLYWLEKSGLEALLPELLATRVYVGISAGSKIAAKKLVLPMYSEHAIYEDIGGEYKRDTGLGFVDFEIFPHFNGDRFPDRRAEKIKEWAGTIPHAFYALDNDSAVKVVDGKIEVISEGKWEKFN